MRYDASLVGLAILAVLVEGCGERKPFDRGEELSPAVLGGSGGSRTQTTQTSTTKPGTKKALYNIVNVTQIIPATSGIAEWAATDMPFAGPVIGIGDTTLNTQTPFQFTYDYPQNNYQFVEAHLVIDTQKDSSDTEAIFIDGVLSGRPPSNVRTNSPYITDSVYVGSAAPTPNTYYIDWGLTHYEPNFRNTFDLNVADLLAQTDKTPIGILSDGKLNVVTSDDSPIFQAFLVLRGRTISTSALSCTTSNTYTFTNDYLHNDGNTLGQNAVKDSVGNANVTWNTAYDGTQFYYDSVLPKVELENITLTTAQILVTAKKPGAGAAAVIVNGIGISQTGFNRSAATDVVEAWDDAATTKFNTFMNNVSTSLPNGAATTLNLLDLLGADRVRELLGQGKLNITFAGNIRAYAGNPTANRAVGVQVAGPRLQLAGTYFTEVCAVPNDPTSPLTQDGLVQSDEEEVGDETVVTNDGAGPEMTSVQAVEITSNKATIIWMTDEPSTSQVRYGVGSLTAETVEDTVRTTYHQVELTGLSPYKYYSFQVVSKDKFGNETVSEIDVFVTLR